MRTRKLLGPAEKVWVDKHRYDEAERLHYEREATLAASASRPCQELVAMNGFCHDEPGEEEPKGELCRAGSSKKRKKRKCPPRAGPLEPRVDAVLAGLLADRVWLDKPLFDQAEAAYRKKLADALLQAASETPRTAEQSALVPWSEAEPLGGLQPRRSLAVLQCSHGSLIACHHLVQDVWVNKVNFDDAEKTFVEKCESTALPQALPLSSVPWQGHKDPVEQQTPDEGYGTALPTPSTPAEVTEAVACASTPFVSPDTPGELDQTVNGKPQMAGLQALVSEVWLEKPIYDDAERSFYTNMFDGHPPGKVRLQERGRPESLKRSRKDKSRSTGKRGNAPASTPTPQDVSSMPSTWYFMHKDSESLWLHKPMYDNAEAQYYAAKALKLASEQENARMSGPVLTRDPPPAARPSSTPESNAKKMAATFLMHEKIWFDKFKYDDAERRYYEQMNGPAHAPSCQQENGASTILRDIARARENIQKSLAGCCRAVQVALPDPSCCLSSLQSGSATSSAGPSGDQNELVARIANLETENRNLRSVVTDLHLAISRLETRLSVLEKASTYHHLSQTPPTQHVTPMRKVEPLPALSRKVELPASSLGRQVESPGAAAAADDDDDDDDDIDLFGSDDEEEDQEAARVREERLRQYTEKKSKKPGLIAKSSILLDVKPWDDETDMAKMEECVRTIQLDGLVWGASKLVPVGYGIKKLQIQCVVEDDKVGTDILEEEITRFEDYVQSVDIAAFNKI
ncbi:elongation factor 1-delta isoform X2 [Paroedura picta]|uniref:elongation factor 1-delta isoform X2 n=1 Tax=Paroedura picta TaxID=143630 RepID=UPI00405790F8